MAVLRRQRHPYRSALEGAVVAAVLELLADPAANAQLERHDCHVARVEQRVQVLFKIPCPAAGRSSATGLRPALGCQKFTSARSGVAARKRNQSQSVMIPTQ